MNHADVYVYVYVYVYVCVYECVCEYFGEILTCGNG